MDNLLKQISSCKNFYGSDIEMKDLVESFSYNEVKSIRDALEKHTKELLGDNLSKGEVMGYYVCKGMESFNFYIVVVDNKIYLAFETLPPYFWYNVESYEEFKKLRKIFNKKGDNFQNKVCKISLGLSKNAEVGSFMETMRGDYEYVTFLYNMCIKNTFLSDNIFGTDELYDKYIDTENYNSLEHALLIKYIMDKERGFCVRTKLSKSIVLFRVVRGVIFISYYYDSSIKSVGGSDIPIDLLVFLTNFNVKTIQEVIMDRNKLKLLELNGSLPVDYYGEMRFEIHKYLVSREKEIDNVNNDNDDNYDELLKSIFTDYTVHKIFMKWGDKYEDLKELSDEGIKKLLKDEFTKEEKKCISESRLSDIKFKKDKSD